MAGKMLLLACLAIAEAASISYPAHSSLDFNFDQFGVKVGVQYSDKARPLQGGRVHLELPGSLLRRVVKGEPSLASQVLAPFKQELYAVYQPSLLERICDVDTIRMEIYYNLQRLRSGQGSAVARYSIAHPDQSQESGSLKIEKEGQRMVLQLVPEQEITTRSLIRPLEVKISKQQKQIRLEVQQEEAQLEASVSQRGQVFEAEVKQKTRQQQDHQLRLRLDVGQQRCEVSRSEEGEEKTILSLQLEGDSRSGSARLSGRVEASPYWRDQAPLEAVIRRSGDKVEASCSFDSVKLGSMDLDLSGGYIKLQARVYLQGWLTIDLDTATGHYNLTLPREWFHDSKTLEVELRSAGQDCTISLKREGVVFYTVTMTNLLSWSSVKSAVTLETKNTKLVDSIFEIAGVSKEKFCRTLVSGCFSKGKYSLEATSGMFNFHVEKEDAMVMMLDIKGSSSHLVLNLFYPRFFMTTLNKPFEKLTVSMDTTKDSITIKSNFDNLKMVLKKQSKTAKMTVFKHNKVYVDLSLDYSLGHQTSIESQLTLSQKSMIHQQLCAYSPHLCFQNIHYHLQLTPSVHHYEHSITKDDKNVISIIASFGQKPYTLHFDSPYILPFYKYITTQKSLISSYLDPLPVILSPCEIKMKMDSEMHLTWNIDMKEGSVDVTPTQSDKYQLVYHSGEVTKKLEFTLTETMFEYQQVKLWRDEEGGHLQYTTEQGVQQRITLKHDTNSATLAVDFKHEGSYVSQEVTAFLPYKTGKGYSFYLSWAGEGELPYIRSYSVQGSLGLGSGTSKVAELVTVLDHLKLVLSVIHTRGLHYDFNLDYHYVA